MKLKKIAVLLMAVVMVVSVLTSCANTPKVTVKISFIDQKGSAVIDTYTAELKKENPTVADAVNALSDAYATAEDYANITWNEDGSAVKDVDAFKENLTPDENKMIKYWTFLVNGKEVKGDANDIVVQNDDIIVYEFVEEAIEE